jgi:hypothetical protein
MDTKRTRFGSFWDGFGAALLLCAVFALLWRWAAKHYQAARLSQAFNAGVADELLQDWEDEL